jgi:hypothetical protein
VKQSRERGQSHQCRERQCSRAKLLSGVRIHHCLLGLRLGCAVSTVRVDQARAVTPKKPLLQVPDLPRLVFSRSATQHRARFLENLELGSQDGGGLTAREKPLLAPFLEINSARGLGVLMSIWRT